MPAMRADREHVAFRDVAGLDAGQGLGPHDDARAGDRDPVGLGLVRDIDHAGAAFEVGVRQVRQAQQPPRRRRDIAGPHQRLADQEAARPGGGEPVEIGRIVDAAFADDDTVWRHQRRQFLGGAADRPSASSDCGC